jgi:type I restriction-modification system DNA methylase subunit
LPAPLQLKELIEKYDRNREQYSSSGYKEAELRKEFLDPLFELLGWDMSNKAGNAEQYKDVVHEQSLDVEGATKAPDYAFRIGETIKFFVEAKKPSVDIGSDPKPAFQLRRYSFSAKLQLSILTNFEQTYVYDNSRKPSKDDKVMVCRIMHFQWDQLLDRWDELSSVFSRDAVMKGSFDRYAAAPKGKRGTTEVDDAFLKDIEGWREELAKNLALRNGSLSIEDMNYAVGKLIDRIIFLRICEDRGTETSEQLRSIVEKDGVYKRLVDLFQLADAKYNSGLFHFAQEAKRSGHPDLLTPKLEIDDKVLRDIVKGMYYPDSPYQFDVIPADILGQVYEQFLGKVIRLTAGHQAKVEEKPEVKKAGGVYYTPKYIVDYIVENTVGKLCASKTPDEMAKLRILDPACGSGSFLIVAYSRLLKEHLAWYSANNPKKWKNEIFQGPKGEWRLTLHVKKKILLNSIYGVDIDSQAVEVTKLNLLLKALEGESKESVDNVKKWFREPALPDLGENVKCGNSLVGFEVRKILESLPENERIEQETKLNPHEWADSFPGIMKSGGFDAIIGNPPYVRQETLGDVFKQYAKASFSTYAGTADLYVYFIEESHHILRDGGLFGMICSNKFMRANYGEALRRFITEKTTLVQIVDFGELPVFENAATFPAIILTRNQPVKAQSFLYAPIKRLNFQSLADEVKTIGSTLDNRAVSGENWMLAGSEELAIIEKMKKIGKPLREYVEGNIYRGVITGLNEAFVIDEETRFRLISEDGKCVEIIKPFVIGDNIRKYHVDYEDKYLLLIPSGWTDANRGDTDPAQYFKNTYHAVAKHLAQFEEMAKNRWDQGDYWWELRPCDYYDKFEGPKIIYPDIAKESRITFDEGGLYFGNTAYFIPIKDHYFLGLLNSTLIFYYYKKIASVLGDANRGGRLRWFTQDVERIPIRTIDYSNPSEIAQHDRMVALVERMLKLHKDRQAEKLPDRIEKIERQIQAADKEIDALVYELYGLTEEEIKIVEGS